MKKNQSYFRVSTPALIPQSQAAFRSREKVGFPSWNDSLGHVCPRPNQLPALLLSVARFDFRTLNPTSLPGSGVI